MTSSWNSFKNYHLNRMRRRHREKVLNYPLTRMTSSWNSFKNYLLKRMRRRHREKVLNCPLTWMMSSWTSCTSSFIFLLFVILIPKNFRGKWSGKMFKFRAKKLGSSKRFFFEFWSSWISKFNLLVYCKSKRHLSWFCCSLHSHSSNCWVIEHTAFKIRRCFWVENKLRVPSLDVVFIVAKMCTALIRISASYLLGSMWHRSRPGYRVEVFKEKKMNFLL
jgi:hypothetical protein